MSGLYDFFLPTFTQEPTYARFVVLHRPVDAARRRRSQVAALAALLPAGGPDDAGPAAAASSFLDVLTPDDAAGESGRDDARGDGGRGAAAKGKAGGRRATGGSARVAAGAAAPPADAAGGPDGGEPAAAKPPPPARLHLFRDVQWASAKNLLPGRVLVPATLDLLRLDVVTLSALATALYSYARDYSSRTVVTALAASAAAYAVRIGLSLRSTLNSYQRQLSRAALAQTVGVGDGAVTALADMAVRTEAADAALVYGALLDAEAAAVAEARGEEEDAAGRGVPRAVVVDGARQLATDALYAPYGVDPLEREGAAAVDTLVRLGFVAHTPGGGLRSTDQPA